MEEAIGLGCMGITHASGAFMTVAEGVKVLQQALDYGYTLFDTAECYTGINGDGSTVYNEEVVGEALHSVRDKVVIATKCGVQHGKDRLIVDSRPETIRKSVEGSLKRLRTDYIDLYYQHRIDPQISPEEVAGTMAELIQEGKIRHWGISEVNEEILFLRKGQITGAICRNIRKKDLKKAGNCWFFYMIWQRKRVLLRRRFHWRGCYVKSRLSFQFPEAVNRNA